jgi:polysaccharide export outer membrane protein
MKHLASALSVLTLTLAGIGCSGARQSDLQAEGPQGLFRPATEMDVSAKEYRVAPPDKLKITAPAVPEIKEIITQIRPDGKISLNLLGEIYVANKTPEEISQLVTQAATKYYNNPDIRIQVEEYNSKFFEVFGTAARDGGRKPYTGRDTVVSALSAAGLSEDAWPQQVAISRPAKNGQPRATAIVNVKHMYMTGDIRQNYLLEEGDIIYIPDSPLATWRKTTQNIAGPLGTTAGAAGAVQSVGPTRTGTR